MDDKAKLKALKTYFDLMAINGGARIYRVAREFGIFDVIGSEQMAAEVVAEKCGLREKPVKLMLEALCAINTIRCQEGKYSLMPVMQFLSKNYKNLSDEYWDYLPQLLKDGIPIAKMDSVEQSEEQYKKQVTALAWMMKPAAEAAAMMLGIGKSRRGVNILDVGAGSAVWSLTFAQRDPDTKVTALDWPAVLKIAVASAEDMGIKERFHILPGNYHEVKLADEIFDMAIVGNVTHIETPEGNQALFQKLYRALKPGGEIVIFDVMPGQEEGNLARTLYALGLALRTEKGQVYSREELEHFLQQTGFIKSTFMPIQVLPYTMGMIFAKKER